MTSQKNKILLEVKDLAVEYRTDESTVKAVNGISFTLDCGETIGLVGETGAGKTTTALALMKLLPERTAFVTAGSIRFDGIDLMHAKDGDMRAIRGARISMIFQDPMTSLNPVLTVGKQISEAVEMHNPDFSAAEVEARTEQMFELVGIPAKRMDEYPHQFSGGMKQRVVIAMALACDPELLIADEPTTALDVTIQAQVLAMMHELKQKLNTSMLMITHDLGIVAKVCDKVAVMYAGRLIEYGTVADIFGRDRHHPYTVGLFGSIPNLSGGSKRLTPIEGMMADPTNLPAGCSFSPRCPKCMDICRKTPPAAHTDGTHSIACHLFDEGEAK